MNGRLFHKSNAGCGLTDAGERLLARAEAVESAYVVAKAAASDEVRTITRTVRIGAPDGFGNVFLAPRVRALTDRHPQVEIEIVPSARLFSLLKREAEIAIGLSSPEHMRVASRRLTDHRLYVDASRAYPKRRRRSFPGRMSKSTPSSALSMSRQRAQSPILGTCTKPSNSSFVEAQICTGQAPGDFCANPADLRRS